MNMRILRQILGKFEKRKLIKKQQLVKVAVLYG